MRKGRGTCQSKGIKAFVSLASTYETWFASPLGMFVDQQEMQALARILIGFRPGSILEIGAGTGHIARFFARYGYQVTAIEPSPAMRAEGIHRTEGFPIYWHAARAEHLPFPNNRFEGAVFFTTLEFVEHPVKALQEARRVVQPDGWVVVGFLHALSPWAAWYRYQADQGRPPWVAATFFTRAEVEHLIGQPAESSETAVYLAPQAVAPFEEADNAGRRAGNQPALEILQWRKSR